MLTVVLTLKLRKLAAVCRTILHGNSGFRFCMLLACFLELPTTESMLVFEFKLINRPVTAAAHPASQVVLLAVLWSVDAV